MITTIHCMITRRYRLITRDYVIKKTLCNYNNASLDHKKTLRDQKSGCDRDTFFDHNMSLHDHNKTPFDHNNTLHGQDQTLCYHIKILFYHNITLCDHNNKLFDHNIRLCDHNKTLFWSQHYIMWSQQYILRSQLYASCDYQIAKPQHEHNRTPLSEVILAEENVVWYILFTTHNLRQNRCYQKRNTRKHTSVIILFP